MASSSPARRSASRTPSPWRGWLTDAGRGAGRARVESRRDGRQPVAVDRAAGKGEDPRDAPAFRGPGRHPRDDKLVERAGQRRIGELPAGRQQLLGDQRQPSRPFGDQQKQARRRALALDPLDQCGQLVAVERQRGRSDRAGAGPDSIAARSVQPGSSRPPTSGWNVPTMASR